MQGPKSNRTARSVRWPALLLLMVLAVAACGGDDSEASAGFSVEPVDDSTDESATSTNGEAAPDISFTYFDGSAGTLDDFAGTPVVVNFWASWCAPCVAEMPDLEAVFQESGGDVAFLGFNSSDQRSDADELLVRTGVTYTIAEDPDGAIHRAFRGFAMPTTILISADGTVTRSHAGAISADQLQGMIAEDFGL
jgi:cytochrome c biogenesis protein CcmG/thiol:disulfide interchange protein DsbE